MKFYKLLIVGLAFVMPLGCAQTQQPELHISGHYGTVAYEGTVNRTIKNDMYTFLVRKLTLTFLPSARINYVDSIRNPKLRLVTTELPQGATRGHVTSESAMPLHLTLDKSHLTATVESVRFVVPKSAVEASTYTALGITDGHYLWPFPSQLKPNGKSVP